MANDTINLLHEDFDYMIEDLREQGQIKAYGIIYFAK